MSMTAPGKNVASINPRKNRATTSPAKDWVAAWQTETTPLLIDYISFYL